jgi:hypothetical protein
VAPSQIAFPATAPASLIALQGPHSRRSTGRSSTGASTTHTAIDAQLEPGRLATSREDAHGGSGPSGLSHISAAPRPRPTLEQLRSRWRDQPCDGIRVQWPEVGQDRVRRVITWSGVRRRYAIPCYRCGDQEAQCEAAEEAAACILLDACPGIEFQEQPLTLRFSWLGKIHRHIPDLLVASPDHYEFWKCKRDTEAGNFWIRKRAERLQMLLAPTGIGCRPSRKLMCKSRAMLWVRPTEKTPLPRRSRCKLMRERTAAHGRVDRGLHAPWTAGATAVVGATSVANVDARRPGPKPLLQETPVTSSPPTTSACREAAC